MKMTLAVLTLLVTVMPLRAETVWLVIGASDATPSGIAKKAKRLQMDDNLIVQTADCGDKESVFAWAIKMEPTAAAAKAELQRVREIVPDAYIKRCDVKTQSLLSHGVSAVDQSIADVPDSAVNWDEKDMISTIEALADGRALVVSRYFETLTDDPLEGRRERVLLVCRGRKPQVLERNCINAARVVTMGGYLAFECAREQAGDHLMHSVLVFDRTGTRKQEFNYCRTPSFKTPDFLFCQKESVTPEGELRLEKVKVRLR